jgi:hypothetical protein
MRARVVLACLMVVASGVSACLDLGDVQDPGSDASSSGGGGSTGWPDAGGDGNCGSCFGGTPLPGPPAGFHYGTFAVAPPDGTSCPDGFMTAKTYGDNLVDPGCGACSCGSPGGGACTVHGMGFAIANCSGTAFFDKTGSCIDSGPAQGMKFQIEPSPGSCTPSAAPNPASYASSIIVCDAQVATQCPCWSKPADPFNSTACLIADTTGDLGCPPGFPVKRAFGEGIADQRVCSGCSCGSSATTCTATSAAFCNSCSSGCVGTAAPAACVDTTTPIGIAINADLSAASCTPSGQAQASGSLAPAKLHVVCCQ